MSAVNSTAVRGLPHHRFRQIFPRPPQPREIVTQGLAVDEGLETVLAGMAKGFRPAWALGDASNIEKFPVISGLEALTILVDNDPSGRGQHAALECSQRWTRSGREVLRAIPDETRYDFNDLLIRTAAA
jgi:putative DNA primase/helicase